MTAPLSAGFLKRGDDLVGVVDLGCAPGANKCAVCKGGWVASQYEAGKTLHEAP